MFNTNRMREPVQALEGEDVAAIRAVLEQNGMMWICCAVLTGGASSFESYGAVRPRRISLLFVQGFRVYTSGFMMGNLARFVAVCCFGA